MKDERVYLGHIRDAINDIKSYAEVGEAESLVNRMRQDAGHQKVRKNRRVVKRLSETTRARQPEIPWKQIASMRDRLTHDYFGVDLGLVLRVVARGLQILEAALGELLASRIWGLGGTAIRPAARSCARD